MNTIEYCYKCSPYFILNKKYLNQIIKIQQNSFEFYIEMKSLKVIFALTLLFKKSLYICFVSQKECFVLLYLKKKKIKLKKKTREKKDL